MKTMLGEREKFGGDVWWYINWIHMQAKLSVYLNLVKCIYSTWLLCCCWLWLCLEAAASCVDSCVVVVVVVVIDRTHPHIESSCVPVSLVFLQLCVPLWGGETDRQTDRQILRICAYSSEFRERWWHCYLVTVKRSRRRSIVELWNWCGRWPLADFSSKRLTLKLLEKAKRRERERARGNRERRG
jgi:hypothetical protein